MRCFKTVFSAWSSAADMFANGDGAGGGPPTRPSSYPGLDVGGRHGPSLGRSTPLASPPTSRSPAYIDKRGPSREAEKERKGKKKREEKKKRRGEEETSKGREDEPLDYAVRPTITSNPLHPRLAGGKTKQEARGELSLCRRPYVCVVRSAKQKQRRIRHPEVLQLAQTRAKPAEPHPALQKKK